MGLDIEAFSKIQFVKSGDVEEEVEDLVAQGVKAFMTPTNPAFPEAAKKLVKGGLYQLSPGGTTFSFRAGSYSSYNRWREILSVMFYGFQPHGIWSRVRKFRGKPFVELINFSDAEGIFAGKTLVKLSKDFQQNYPVAKNKIQGVLDDSNEEYDLEGWDSSQWLSVYKNFMKAFGLASPDGALLFQ